jgi:hypothetical protein
MLDQSLGQLRRDPARAEQPVLGVDYHPGAVAAMRELADLGSPVEILIPDVGEGESWAALTNVAPGGAVVRPVTGLAAASEDPAGGPGDATMPGVLVAADRVRRAEAAALGFAPVPHLALAAPLADGEALSFVQINASREDIESLPGLLPYFLERQADGTWMCLGVVPQTTLAGAALRRLRIVVLALDVGLEDPLLVQLDNADQTALEAFAALRLLAADGQRVLVALAPNQSTDDIAFHGAHGHFTHLAPSPGLLRPVPAMTAPSDATAWAAELAGGTGLAVAAADEAGEQALAAAVETCPATAAEYAAIVDRYSGASDPGGGPILSRHAAHPDNPRAVDVLLAELRGMGYCATTHAFEYGGRTLHNVIADLPGRGVVNLQPDVREQVRERLLTTAPSNGGVPAELQEAASLVNLDAAAFSDGDAGQVRAAVEQAAGLQPWQTWWLQGCPLPGVGADLVIVGCHLDSTANRNNPIFDPTVDTSPGKDDNASGMGGVLAIARQLAERNGTLTHTVRFGFFNAEEHGLVGSRAYAEAMKAANAPIRAVICMDMIGFNNDASRTFELHAGFTDPAVRDLSDPIAQRIATAALGLGALPPAQIYRGTAPGGPADSDRDKFDGAIGRSDHAAFQEQGYPGVVATEDFFINRPGEAASEPNPNYHSKLDTVVDASYAADIVCAVAQAVHELAR